MAKGKYIYSTLTGDQIYPVYKDVQPGQIPQIAEKVFINGGANLASKALVTPKGVVTHVTDAEWELLQKCSAFQKHVNGGWITVEDREYEPDSVAAHMEPKDQSAPKTDKDFEEEGILPPSTAGDSAEESERAPKRTAAKKKASRRRRGSSADSE